jgi:hypothetical protein
MNALWQVGEAVAKTKDMAPVPSISTDTFSQACDQPTDRLATMQKASALLPVAGITSLMACMRRY